MASPVRWACGVAAALVAVGCGPARPLAPEPPRGLRVGTWNIEWLGQPDKRHSKQLQSPDDIAGYVAACGVDVFGLNEVSRDGEAGGFGTNSVLTKAFEKLSRETGGSWRHVLFPKEDPAEADQLVGVAWDQRRVTLVGEPWRVPVRRPPGASLWNRHPWAAKFSAGEGRTDFVLVPVHMKSNAGGQDVTAKQRAEEAKALVRGLGAVQNQFADDDVVVLGDTNMLSSNELGSARYRSAGLRDLNAHDEPTWIAGGDFKAAPFDRLFVPDDQPEFAAAALRVHTVSPLGSEAAFRERLSDHYLTSAEINVTADDD